MEFIYFKATNGREHYLNPICINCVIHKPYDNQKGGCIEIHLINGLFVEIDMPIQHVIDRLNGK